MTLLRLICRNIAGYARSWMLTLAGVILGTAVLTGALITGDSVRHSLTAMVTDRLGTIRCAMAPADRFFLQELATGMSKECGFPVVAVLKTRGVVSSPAGGITLSRATIVGVDRSFAELWEKEEGEGGFLVPEGDEAVISANTAKFLDVKPGDEIVVRVSEEGFAPANAPFVSVQSATKGIRVKVAAVAGDRTGGKFGLENNQAAPFNIFLPLPLLAAKKGIAGFANTLLAASGDQPDPVDRLNRALRQSWTLPDAGIVETRPAPGIRQWASRRIFMEDTLCALLQDAVPDPVGILTYLVNEISLMGKSAPYSFVAAAGPGIATVDPRPGEIVINRWLSDDLDAQPGDTVTLRYWTLGTGRSLREQTALFRVSSVAPVEDNEAARALMPDFPGMKNSGNCRDWETGTPVDLKKIRGKDEEYWKRYRGTPKAWITLTDGQRLWKNPFGSVTAIRSGTDPGSSLPDEILRSLDPALLGLRFTPVYDEGLTASAGSTDFGELFLSLGALVVISGLILSGMLLSFYLRIRNREGALMRALGFTHRRITAILLPEILVISLAGGILGVAVAVGYSRLIVAGLNTLWEEAVNTTSLRMSVEPATLVRGFLAGMILNLILFLFILFRNRRNRLPSRYTRHGTKVGQGISRPGPAAYVCRSLRYRRTRTLTAVILMALGTFTVLVTAMNRRQGGRDSDNNRSGTGGFPLWMETGMPIEADLNSKTGRTKMGIDEDPVITRSRFVPLAGIGGDDASCLNLNLVTKPAVLGIPAAYFDRRSAFSFARLLPAIDHRHPWQSLLTPPGPGIILGFADQTVLTWGLHKKVGDTLFYTDEQGRRLGILIAGGLENSIFQGSILVADSLLRLHFPSSARVNRMLVETPAEMADTLARLLEERLRDQGTVVMPTRERIASFAAVTNTYLDVFILLGGLGLIIGTAGLAVLVMRTLHERKEELALLRALGFTPALTLRMLAGEFLFILVAGVAAGTLAATAVNLPLILHGGIHTLLYLLLLAGIVLAIGVLWICWTARRMMGKGRANDPPQIRV